MSNTTEAVSQLESMLDDNGWVAPEGEVEFVKVEVDEDGEPIEQEEEETSEEEETEEDSEEETEDEEVDTEDEESEDSSEEEELFELQIGDETYEVNKEELFAGYLRNEELVKRQTELETVAAEREAELEAERQRLADYLDEVILEGNVTLQKYKNVNWNELRAEDPEAYRQVRLEYVEAQEQQEARLSRRNAIAQMHKQAQAIKHQAYLRSQHELAQKLIPELKEEGFNNKIIEFGKSIGYSEDELRGIADAKALFVLNQARLYAESQVRKKAALEKKVSKDLPPVVKPGAPKTKAQESSNKQREAVNRLRQTKNLRDAASVLMDYV